jgi:hypothetical protein
MEHCDKCGKRQGYNFWDHAIGGAMIVTLVLSMGFTLVWMGAMFIDGIFN